MSTVYSPISHLRLSPHRHLGISQDPLLVFQDLLAGAQAPLARLEGRRPRCFRREEMEILCDFMVISMVNIWFIHG